MSTSSRRVTGPRSKEASAAGDDGDGGGRRHAAPSALGVGASRLGLLIVLLSAGSPLCAEQVCDTRLYPLSSPTERFDDHRDGTVTDRTSNLMWMRCSAGQEWSADTCRGRASGHDWRSAHALAGEVNRRGNLFFKDWRVPKLRELATIIERECRNPRVNLEVFPNTPAGYYWTDTSRPGDEFASFAFALSFGDDGVGQWPKDKESYVRLVRNAQ